MYSVLLIDDEPFIRMSLASMRAWEDDGFELRYEAANGREALDLLAAHPEIDIVVVDLSMPVMDGIEFLKLMPGFCGEHERTVPVPLILSSYNDFSLVREAFTLGAKDYLLKSEMDGERMLAMLKKLADGIEHSQESSQAILRRRHRDFLKEQFLRDALNKAPPEDWQGLFGTLDIKLRIPLSLCTVKIEDFAALRERFADQEFSQFQDLMHRAVLQVLSKHGSGELVAMTESLWVLFLNLSDPGGQGAFCEDLQEYLARYLSIRTACQMSPEQIPFERVPDTFREMSTRKNPESRIVVLARRYMREHHADPELCLEDIATFTGVSKNHLSWEFSRETGETVTAYLTRIRTDEAKKLLADPSIKVSDVAEQVGYPNVEHFSRVFKKVTGISPNRWSDVASTISDAAIPGS